MLVVKLRRASLSTFRFRDFAHPNSSTKFLQAWHDPVLSCRRQCEHTVRLLTSASTPIMSRSCVSLWAPSFSVAFHEALTYLSADAPRYLIKAFGNISVSVNPTILSALAVHMLVCPIDWELILPLRHSVLKSGLYLMPLLHVDSISPVQMVNKLHFLSRRGIS